MLADNVANNGPGQTLHSSHHKNSIQVKEQGLKVRLMKLLVMCVCPLPRADLAAVYRAADWVVSASAFETFGNVPYEAGGLLRTVTRPDIGG
jgi:glycosyltransferase involved in cell wall biosynthesis